MPLLAAAERPPYFVVNPGAAAPLVIVGDHSGAAVPASLDALGLPAPALGMHIALDIGVADLGERLAHALGATFIGQRYSRLVIDCNRDPDRDDSICAVSDGVVVPGNRGLSVAARARRRAEVFEPYHARIAAELDARRAAGQPTRLLALHSFTPVMSGQARPWRFGVLHLGDSPLSRCVLERLRGELGEAAVGDNQPYRMDATDYTVARHARARGLDYLELEVRQDTLADAAGRAATARMLAPLLAQAPAG